jgi:sn1-specific diacylglycerol lipase
VTVDRYSRLTPKDSSSGYLLCPLKRNSSGDSLGCHRIAFLKETGLDPDCFVYATFQSGVKKRPYCIIVDKERKAVVIVIRGSLSMEDIVTDFTLKPEPLDAWEHEYGFGGGAGEYCHAGIFESVEWLMSDLKSHGLLDSMLRGEDCSYPGYRLYVIGHSLGAGVAAVLSLILHQSFPELKCLCFSPPAILSEKLARQEYITTYVVNYDIIPRLSLQSMQNLRDDVLLMIPRIKVPKHHVLGFSRFQSVGEENEDLFHGKKSIPECKFVQQLKELKNRTTERSIEDGFGVNLVIPGAKLVHIIRTSEKNKSRCGRSKKDEYTAVWAEVEDFAEIVVASSFVGDHEPGNCASVLKEVADSF